MLSSWTYIPSCLTRYCAKANSLSCLARLVCLRRNAFRHYLALSLPHLSSEVLRARHHNQIRCPRIALITSSQRSSAGLRVRCLSKIWSVRRLETLLSFTYLPKAGKICFRGLKHLPDPFLSEKRVLYPSVLSRRRNSSYDCLSSKKRSRRRT